MTRRQLVILFVGSLALLGGYATHSISGLSPEENHIDLSEVSFADLSGTQRSLSDWSGKILIINFWATWCPPCIVEIPDFIKLQKRYRTDGVQFIGIAIDNAEAVAEFNHKQNFNYPILIAENEGFSFSLALGNIAAIVPFSAVIDRNGVVVHRQTGVFPESVVEKTLTPLLKK